VVFFKGVIVNNIVAIFLLQAFSACHSLDMASLGPSDSDTDGAAAPERLPARMLAALRLTALGMLSLQQDFAKLAQKQDRLQQDMMMCKSRLWNYHNDIYNQIREMEKLNNPNSAEDTLQHGYVNLNLDLVDGSVQVPTFCGSKGSKGSKGTGSGAAPQGIDSGAAPQGIDSQGIDSQGIGYGKDKKQGPPARASFQRSGPF
jgi:hypothetical protein